MLVACAIGLTLLNALFWVSIIFSLPGTWLMVLCAVLLQLWTPCQSMFGWPVLVAAAGLAGLGEVLEFALGAAGARRAGGTRRAAALAIAGAFVGALVGTGVPVPIVGTLVGACVGAFVGSLVGDLWAGRTFLQSVLAGKGAAMGRLWGTVSKLAIGAAILILLATAALL